MAVQEDQSVGGVFGPYAGYFMRGVPAHDGELTETGPGTPMGEYMRRFWQPVCLAGQLRDLPVALKVLGEDLVAFRDKSGEVGVLHRHCSHRGTPLEYGIVSEHGIRCCYHGWLFDVDGTVLETPGESPHSRLKESVVHGAYPACERDGLVFGYMGWGPPTRSRRSPRGRHSAVTMSRRSPSWSVTVITGCRPTRT